MSHSTEFPGISDSLQDVAQMAHELGLSLAQYNSGAARNPLNGFRLLPGTGRHDYFATDHIRQFRTKAEVREFLVGFDVGRSSV